MEGDALLAGLASAAGVFYNFSGQNLDCFDWSAGPNEESEEDTDFWGYQWCVSATDIFYTFSGPALLCLTLHSQVRSERRLRWDLGPFAWAFMLLGLRWLWRKSPYSYHTQLQNCCKCKTST